MVMVLFSVIINPPLSLTTLKPLTDDVNDMIVAVMQS